MLLPSRRDCHTYQPGIAAEQVAPVVSVKQRRFLVPPESTARWTAALAGRGIPRLGWRRPLQAAGGQAGFAGLPPLCHAGLSPSRRPAQAGFHSKAASRSESLGNEGSEPAFRRICRVLWAKQGHRWPRVSGGERDSSARRAEQRGVGPETSEGLWLFFSI